MTNRPPDLPDDPFPDELFATSAFDYAPEEDVFDPFPDGMLPDESAPSQPAPLLNADDGWHWHDAAIIAVERMLPDGEADQYSIGAVDLYANTHTGDVSGNYLEIGAFDDIDEAAALYHDLQAEIHRERLLPFQLVDLAEERAAERGDSSPEWRAAGEVELHAYEQMRTLDTSILPDLPPEDFALEDLFDLETEPTRAVDPDSPSFKALHEIGVTADGFDPDTDPPPFIDAETGTAYWIGVFQPDKDDPSNCVTSILTLGRDPDTGEVEAQLAPCVPGEWDKAYGAAEYLLGVLEKGGIERTFDAAEGMALAADQRALWERERGIPLEPDAAQDLADYTRDQWEIDL